MRKRHTYTRVHTHSRRRATSHPETQAETRWRASQSLRGKKTGQPGASAPKLASGDRFRWDLWSGDREALSQSLHLSVSALNCKIGTITPVL